MVDTVICSQNRKIISKQLVSMSPAFPVNYVARRRQITNVKVDFEKFMVLFITVLYIICKRSRRWRNNMCFFKGYCVLNGTSVYTVCKGLSHSGKYDFLDIVKTNIPLGFNENIINFYFHYFICWLIRDQIVKYTWKHR